MALARAKAAGPNDPVDPVADENAVLTALTSWFASRAAISDSELPVELLDRLVGIGVARQAAAKAGEWVLAKPLTGRSRHGAPAPLDGMPATRRVATEEPAMRAQYLLAAARRLTTALAGDRYEAALEAERRYLDAHVAAGRNRRAAARKVDEAAQKSPVLRWVTVMDENTTPECAALDGRLFTVTNPPGIPGAMHSRCRCTAEPWGSSAAAHLAHLL
jgi:SPP1 gp7 family putative phage head morphogenesis protein